MLDENGRRVGVALRASKYPAIVPDELSETAFMTDQAIDTIRAAGDDSWCIHLSFIAALALCVSEPFHDLVDPLDLPAPNRSDTELEHDHPVLQAFRDLRVSERFPTTTSDAPCIRLPRLVSRSTDTWPFFAELDRLGRTDDTMIVLTSDHGDYMGDHWLAKRTGCTTRSCGSDDCRRPPTGRDVTRNRFVRTVEAIDLVPTFVDATGEITPRSTGGLRASRWTPLLHGQPQEREMAICQSEFAYVELGPTDDPRCRRAICCERIASSTSSGDRA